MRYTDPIEPEAIPSKLLELLERARQRIRTIKPSSPAFFLVPLIVSTTLGYSHQWLSHIYQLAVSDLPPAPASRSPSPPLPKDETNERRLVVRYIKEALTKSYCTIGAPRAIEALLELDKVVEEGARDDSFVRAELEEGSVRTGAKSLEVGMKGIKTVYKEDIEKILEMMQPNLRDISWISRQITYGSLLTPHADKDKTESPDPFDQDSTLLSVVTLSTIVPQRTPREILWHLRGAIRRGMKRDQVQQLHDEIEFVCSACGVLNVRDGMPTLDEVEKQDGDE